MLMVEDTISKGTFMLVDDVRKTLEATFSNLTPAKAQDIAKGLMEPGAAKDQIAKTAADLMEWSQGSRERLSSYVRKEVAVQMKGMGLATQADLDAVKRRVRDLERAGGPSKPAGSTKKKTAARASTANKKTTARKPAGSAPAGATSSSTASPTSG